MTVQIATGLWYYYVSKLIEFNDTIIFIMRKKYSQLTVLHVYHHITMPFWSWIGVRWFAGGSSNLLFLKRKFCSSILYTRHEQHYSLHYVHLLRSLCNRITNYQKTLVNNIAVDSVLHCCYIRNVASIQRMYFHSQNLNIRRTGIWYNNNNTIRQLLPPNLHEESSQSINSTQHQAIQINKQENIDECK